MTERYSRPVPAECQLALTKAGGLNLYGQPRFRIVWGWDRLSLIGGEWINYADDGRYLSTTAELREWPKYHPLNEYFYFEKYCAPEFYGNRWKWEAQTYETNDGRLLPALGPFPERGDYELSWRCAITKCPIHLSISDCLPSCTSKQYWEALNPTLGIVEHYVAIMMRSEVASNYERLKAIEREQEREERDKKRVQHDILFDSNQLYTGSYIAVPKHYDAILDIWRKEKETCLKH